MTEQIPDITKEDIEGMLGYEDFCTVVNDKLADDGLEKGCRVFISGNQPVPISKDDLYNLRLKMLVCKLDDDNHVMTDKFFLVDPASLERVNEDEFKELRTILEADFKQDEESVH